LPPNSCISEEACDGHSEGSDNTPRREHRHLGWTLHPEDVLRTALKMKMQSVAEMITPT
jgi:hypothetical protein